MPMVPYDNLAVQLWSAGINWTSDTIKLAIASNSYTPVRATHDFFDDITNEIIGTGYTAGGATLGSKTRTLTAADSWGTSRANSTAYVAGDIIRPASANTFVYECITAGTSAASPPTFTTTVGDDYTDGTAVFSCRGKAVLQLDSADVSWTTSTISGARNFILYKSTGTASTSPLIAVDTLAADASATSGTTLTYQVQALGYIVLFLN
jgi:hypothetical protein